MELVTEYIDELHGWDILDYVKPVWQFPGNYYDLADRIQEQYEAAITRRSTYIGDLAGHVLRGGGLVYENQGSYLVGNVVGAVFVVSHFAPKTLRSGYEMVKYLPFPAVAAVPDAQANMLLKAGWRYLTDVPQFFAGEIVMKHVMVSPRVLPQDLQELQAYYM